ncbi:hypothetical protein [Rhodobacter capsulatus]|nr:hypothetical protein [Rhodobacter capsulatus]
MTDRLGGALASAALAVGDQGPRALIHAISTDAMGRAARVRAMI